MSYEPYDHGKSFATAEEAEEYQKQKWPQARPPLRCSQCRFAYLHNHNMMCMLNPPQLIHTGAFTAPIVSTYPNVSMDLGCHQGQAIPKLAKDVAPKNLGKRNPPPAEFMPEADTKDLPPRRKPGLNI